MRWAWLGAMLVWPCWGLPLLEWAMRWMPELPDTPPLPVVIWHGLGDSAYAPWLHSLKEELEHTYPRMYVHLVALESRSVADRAATFVGDVNAQVARVAEQLAQVPELRHGFDAVGFSQGGQFLRAYVERFHAPVRHLITFGSQHMGITALPGCGDDDQLCQAVMRHLENATYTDYAQTHTVVAQYFRDTRTPERFEQYMTHNRFLRDINNEGVAKNASYKEGLQRLEQFVMVRFSDDTTVLPPESAWFGARSVPKDGKNATSVPLRQSDVYVHDWLGLAALDKRGALRFHTCDGMHMQLSPACKDLIFGQYVGRPRSPGRWLATYA
mgnify:CR=1 FL=1